MEFITHHISVKSQSHPRNEDNLICRDQYVVIADGMGGEACGEIASGLAIKAISSCIDENLQRMKTESDYRDLALTAISHADQEISDYISTHPDADGMGTTVILLILEEKNLHLAWCGDSHGYVYDGAAIRSLTKDHSYVQQLIDAGQITLEDSFNHPDNNLITRFVGGGCDTCIPDYCTHQVAEREIIILCSDGLSGYCRPEEVAMVIKKNKQSADLPKELSDLAVRNGSDDDITIAILEPQTHGTAPHGISGWFRKLILKN